MSYDPDLQADRSYRQSPLRYIVLAILVLVMVVLGGMMYLKHKRERDEAAAGEPQAPAVDETKLGVLIPGRPVPKGVLGDPRELDGEYAITQLIRAGKPEPAAGAVTIKDAQFTLPGEKLPYTVKVLDKAKPPFEIDLLQKSEEGQRYTHGLYKQDGETLTFCLSIYRKEKVAVPGVGVTETDVGTPRSANFEATDKNLLVVLKKK